MVKLSFYLFQVAKKISYFQCTCNVTPRILDIIPVYILKKETDKKYELKLFMMEPNDRWREKVSHEQLIALKSVMKL